MKDCPEGFVPGYFPVSHHQVDYKFNAGGLCPAKSNHGSLQLQTLVLDHELDRGLDRGLDHGLDHGLEHELISAFGFWLLDQCYGQEQLKGTSMQITLYKLAFIFQRI
jgi:hypothetical protein